MGYDFDVISPTVRRLLESVPQPRTQTALNNTTTQTDTHKEIRHESLVTKLVYHLAAVTGASSPWLVFIFVAFIFYGVWLLILIIK